MNLKLEIFYTSIIGVNIFFFPVAYILLKYNSVVTSYEDLTVILTIVVLVNVCIISLLVHQWKKEQAKVKAYISELEQHKAKLEKHTYIEEMNVQLKQEIAERVKSQDARRAADEKFSRAFEASPVPMCIVATKPLRFVEVNTSAVETFGYNQADFLASGAIIYDKIMSKEQYNTILREIREHSTINKMKTSFYNKNKVVLSGLLSIEKIIIDEECYWLCVWYDVTHVRNMQMELKRLDSFNVVSKMAVSLAHEIRNPMTTVRGFLQLMGRKKMHDHEYLKMMISEIDRANAIITQFLLMAKERMTDFQLKDINSIINKVLMLVEKDAVKAGYLVTLQSSQIPMIMVDENQIKQMLLNIIRNGIEAMNDEGKLLIRTYVEEASVVLAISDEGPGIAPEIVEQICTPFFTTKQEKSGLGLAVCYSIAARHGAKIKIDTSQKGTTFHIKFKTAIGEC